jgi:hypothetical protein
MVKTIDRRSKLRQIESAAHDIEIEYNVGYPSGNRARSKYVPIRDSKKFDLLNFSADEDNQASYPFIDHLIRMIEKYLDVADQGRRRPRGRDIDVLKDFSVSLSRLT